MPALKSKQMQIIEKEAIKEGVIELLKDVQNYSETLRISIDCMDFSEEALRETKKLSINFLNGKATISCLRLFLKKNRDKHTILI